jgi:hypothetical protein
VTRTQHVMVPPFKENIMATQNRRQRMQALAREMRACLKIMKPMRGGTPAYQTMMDRYMAAWTAWHAERTEGIKTKEL